MVKKEKIGDTFKGGRKIFVLIDSQSLERAEAYAIAFKNVLKLNGVKCSIDTFFD